MSDDGRGALCVRRLIRSRWWVIAFWFAAILTSALFALQLIDAARFNFAPVKGTGSYDAQQRMKADFPSLTFQDMEVILLSCAECPAGIGGVIANSSAIGDFTRRAVFRLRSETQRLAGLHPELNLISTSALDFASSDLRAFSTKNPLLSADNRTALFQMSWEVRPDNQPIALAAFKELTEAVTELQVEARDVLKDYSLALTGPLALFKSTVDITKSDMKQKDLFVLPVALLILGYRVRSWRLTCLTLLNVGMVVGISFAVFLPVAKYLIDISPMVPSVMVFLSIALSIDYSLFLFTRFSEEVGRGSTALDALVPMLLKSGEVVSLSGSVLILCYLGVLLFPGQGISSIGLGASLSIFVAMAANLTLSPCLIAAFPAFFARGLADDRVGQQRRCSQFFGCHSSRNEGIQQRFWFWWGRKVTSFPCMVLVPVLAYCAMIPICMKLLHYRPTFDNSLIFPVDGEASDAYKKVLSMASPGALSPIFLIQNGDVKSEEWFERNANLASHLLEATANQPYALRPGDLVSAAAIPNPLDPTRMLNLKWNSSHIGILPTAQKLLESGYVIGGHDIGAVYRKLWSELVSPSNQSGMLRIQANFDPYGVNMKPFVKCLRDALARFESDTQHRGASTHLKPHLVMSDALAADEVLEVARKEDEVLLYSQLVVIFDIMTVIYERLPYILIAVFSTCFVIIGLVFRAAFVPLKLCMTVLIPLCMVYGMAVLVYQDGILNFLGVRALESTGGIYWAHPVFTVTILTGLALDYDIFLFARVLELRMQGFDNASAVAGAMALTGPTITAAGLIMASAFGGLMLTDIPANNQIGFLMSFAVLMDTFVIRSCLVPAVLVLGSELNYWPRALPAERYSSHDMKLMLSSTMEDDLLQSSEVCRS